MNRLERTLIERNWLPEIVIAVVMLMLVLAGVSCAEDPIVTAVRLERENAALRAEVAQLKAERRMVRLFLEQFNRELGIEIDKQARIIKSNGREIREVSAEMRAVTERTNQLLRERIYKRNPTNVTSTTRIGR